LFLFLIYRPTNEIKAKFIKLANELTEKVDSIFSSFSYSIHFLIAFSYSQARIQIRQERRKVMDQVKAMALPKDEERKTSQRTQTMHDDAIKAIEEKLKAKEKELK
jgi:hypothetical protein